MTIDDADTLVRERCGDKKCPYCDYGLIQTATGFYYDEIECPCCEGSGKARITLADVLMALGDTVSYRRGFGGLMIVLPPEENIAQFILWNLTIPTLEAQDEETKITIANLLK